MIWRGGQMLRTTQGETNIWEAFEPAIASLNGLVPEECRWPALHKQHDCCEGAKCCGTDDAEP